MTDGSKGGAKNTEQPRGLSLIPIAQIKLILNVSDSFLCVPRIQTMISSGPHHRIPPEAIRMEPLFLDPAAAPDVSVSLCKQVGRAQVSPAKRKANTQITKKYLMVNQSKNALRFNI